MGLSLVTGGRAIPPCPAWCSRPAGHDVDDPISEEVDGAQLRHHGREWSVSGTSFGVEIVWTEHVQPGGDRGATEPPALDVYAEDVGDPPTCAQVRMFAQVLAEAANYYDRHVR